MPTPALSLPAPAKLNLFLHILGRRPDGYHNLQTVFQFLDISDTLSFELRDDSRVTVDMPTGAGEKIKQEDNLIWRAATLLQKHCSVSLGAHIRCDKQLPMGGGLGGGSSNAATALIGLNHLWGTNLDTEQLIEIGQPLGADIPVFIHGHSAWAEGTGEQLTSVFPKEYWFLVIIPPVQVSTVKIFQHQELTRDTSASTIAPFLDGAHKTLFHNDCEAVVTKLYPEVRDALSWLKLHNPEARLTGTGACLFASFSTESQAKQLASQVPGNCGAFVAKAVNYSPALRELARLDSGSI